MTTVVFSAWALQRGIDFSRQDLTSVDVRSWRLKSIPVLWTYFFQPETYNIGIQMNQKELTKTFMIISNWIKPFGRHDLFKKKSAL